MKLAEYSTKLVALGEAAAKATVSTIGNDIRQSIKTNQPWRGVDYRDFASLMLKVGILHSHLKRETGEKRSSYNAPSWKDMNVGISAMLTTQPDLRSVVGSIVPTENDIAQFSTFGAISKGPNAIDCVSIAFYVWHLLENDFFVGSFFNQYFSSPEQSTPNKVRSALLSYHPSAGLSSASASPNKPETIEVTGGHNRKRWAGSGISIYFSLKDEHLETFEDYFRRFSFGEDGALHAVIYRPRLSKPGFLMKTFMAIKASRREGSARDSYTFTHIYQPPSETRTDRIALGKVAPLDDGVYLLGGQRPKLNDYKSDTETLPYKSAKILALRWEEIQQHELLLPAVTISTNATGRILASRAAVRITPLDHSEKIELREVACSDLLGNLRKDVKLEAEYLKQARENPELSAKIKNLQNVEHFMKATRDDDIKDACQRIIAMTNNSPGHPTKDAMPDDFVGSDDRPLKVGVVTQRIEDSLAVPPGPFLRNKEAFDLWSHMRFAPLKLD